MKSVYGENTVKTEIRYAAAEELDEIMNIYSAAKHFMEEHGNLTQWTGDDAVVREKMSAMLEKQQLFVGEAEGKLLFAFAYIQGEDPTYRVITKGAWLNDAAYGTIHRLASAGKAKGVVETVTDWALEQNPNLRIDTHHDNLVMQNALAKAGFTRCGIIHLENGDPRIAYQKVKG